jgi:hypothetical protein
MGDAIEKVDAVEIDVVHRASEAARKRDRLEPAGVTWPCRLGWKFFRLWPDGGCAFKTG